MNPSNKVTDDDRQRIYEEERVRAEARAYYENLSQDRTSEEDLTSCPNDTINSTMQPAMISRGERVSPLTTCTWIFGIFVGLFIMVAILSPQRGGTVSHSSSSDSQPEDFEVREIAEKIVSDGLVAPSTADFSPSTEEKVERLYDNPPTYRVTGWVDAQNRFGGKIRSNWSVKLHLTGDKWISDSLDIQSR